MLLKQSDDSYWHFQNNEPNLLLTDIDAEDGDADGIGNGAITFTLDSDFQGRLVHHGEASLSSKWE